jgi:hypothetical protein
MLSRSLWRQWTAVALICAFAIFCGRSAYDFNSSVWGFEGLMFLVAAAGLAFRTWWSAYLIFILALALCAFWVHSVWLVFESGYFDGVSASRRVLSTPAGHRSNYRDASESMSACIRSLYSSDQWAPGFTLVLLRGCGSGGVLLSLGDFSTPAFSLSVTRGDLGFGDGFELFMQLYVLPFGFVVPMRRRRRDYQCDINHPI